MATRSANALSANLFPKNLNLPQPDHTAARLRVALSSFEKDIGPQTGLISAHLAFKIRKLNPSLEQIQSLVEARSLFFKYVYAYMGTQEKQAVDLNNSATVAEGKSLYEKGCEISNKKRAKALHFAIESLFPSLLEGTLRQSESVAAE